MADYERLPDGSYRHKPSGAFIPPDPDNGDYRIYLEWVAAGGVPDEARAAAAPSRGLSGYDFMMRFTEEERAAIRVAAAADPASALADLYERQRSASAIHPGDPEVIGGLGTLEALGLIAQGRAAEILAWR